MRRLRIFIDGGYLFKVFDQYRRAGYRYSCKRLQRKLAESYNLLKVHYYDAINNRDPRIKTKQERFNNKLRTDLGWEMNILPLQWPGGKAKQKGVDSLLTLHLHSLAVKNEYDTAILVAADADFVPPVKSAIEEGRIVRNAYFSARPSFHLIQACNGPFIRLDDLDFVYRDGDPINLLSISSLKLKTK